MITVTSLTSVTNEASYLLDVDPLHRNVYPVWWSDSDTPIGEVTEHITLALDGGSAPLTCWAWQLDDVEAERLGRHWVSERRSTARYNRWSEAYETFVGFHRLAVQSETKAHARAQR